LAAADDYRAVPQRRIVTLLDAGIEGVAIEVGDREGRQFRVPDKARRAAAGAALRLAGRRCERPALTAQEGAGVHVVDCRGRSRPSGVGLRSGAARRLGEAKSLLIINDGLVVL